MLIDLNTVFTEAIVKATESLRIDNIKLRQQVDALQDKNAYLERRLGLLEERVQANSKRTEFLEACAAGEGGAAEDTDARIKLEKRIGMLEERVRVDSSESVEVIRSFGAVPNRVDELEKRINTLRLQLEQRIEEVVSASASYAALEALQNQVDSLQRQVTAIDEANSEDAERFHEDVKAIVADVLNEGLAEAVADAFQNGSLTISVDKV